MKELTDNMRNQCLIARLNIRINLRLSTQLLFIWEPPDPGELKLNTDGSVTPDSARNGGIFRDQYGTVLLCYTEQGGMLLVLHQELKTILNGLRIGVRECYRNIKVASDSRIVAQILNKMETMPWMVENEVLEI
ncbi:hypothetical protein IFM89_035715 [Coptis chinensis]|uniref:RNase H type-1 domain-containing protein n=1 Tax=Coptis chinensis TaxID=261450 RepID=A0A835GZK5_9MAGN|nr:hypothetical protein IFM89_035715 [Coptis chinensis]